MRVEPLRPWHLRLIEPARPLPWWEGLALDPGRAAAVCAEGPGWAGVGDGRVLAVGGLVLCPRRWPEAWLMPAAGLGVRQWGHVLRATSAFLRDVGGQWDRLEAEVGAGDPCAKRWAKRCGFVFEGVRRAAGAAGEDTEAWALVRLECER